MKNLVILNSIIRNSNTKITYDFKVYGQWCDTLEFSEFYVEYNYDISSIPYSIAVIPFLGTFLPLSWLYDAKIIIDELDIDFYLSIPCIKRAYMNMFPTIEILGQLMVKKLCDNKKINNERAICLYSGGVDALFSLISNKNEVAALITIRGADIPLSLSTGWNNIKKQVAKNKFVDITNIFFIESSFREIINEDVVCSYTKKFGDSWWHGFHHGIGIVALVAPIAYVLNVHKVLISASYTEKYGGTITCASSPNIDNNIRFCATKVVHYGYDVSRQKKIKRIIEEYKESSNKPLLRVCWKDSNGGNCCMCEKCFRTALGLLLEGEDPRQYGFNSLGQLEIKKLGEQLGFPDILHSPKMAHSLPYYIEMKDLLITGEVNMISDFEWLLNEPFD